MTDNHIHIGQYEEIYYEPLEILTIVQNKGITEIVYSSTTSGKDGVKYNEVYSEIASVVSVFPHESYKPYLWFVPSYIDEGLTLEKAFSDLPYKGIKLHTFLNNWDFTEKKQERCLHEMFAFAQDKNIPVLIHTGPNGVDAPDRFEMFFAKYPKTKIILAHCRPIEEAVIMLKKYPNVYGDTAFVPEEWIRLLIMNNTENKIVTGSDFPITHYSKTHFFNDNGENITLEEQYQTDIDTMKMYETLLHNLGDF